MNDFRRENHPQPTARSQHRYRGENERDPSICMLGEWQAKKFENGLGFALRILWQVLIPNEGRVPNHGIKFRTPSQDMRDSKIEKVVVKNLRLKARDCKATSFRFGSFLVKDLKSCEL